MIALYPECIALSHTGAISGSIGLDADSEIGTFDFENVGGVQLYINCPAYAVGGLCEHGHRFRKCIICNRQWCEYCGGVDGLAHNRRKARWMSKVQQMRSLGYFVITIPPEIRDMYRTRQALSRLGTAFRRMFQRHGFERGLRFWHFFGDGHAGIDEGRDYHPHLNVLVDRGWLLPEQLEGIKDSVARILKVSRERVNVHYEYQQSVAGMLHVMKYTLRPTFLDAYWDEELAYEVIGLRNAQTWGRWDDEPQWEMPESDNEDEAQTPFVDALERGVCPFDNTPLTWINSVTPTVMLDADHWQDLGGGYYLYIGPDPPS